jgi:hypothetical protein
MPAGEDPINEFLDVLVGRPGWRLEPLSSPGSTALWCFVFNGKIEYSVTVEDGAIHLYVMETDQEIVFADADALMGWLRANRIEAVREPVPPGTRKRRFKRFTDWS